MPHRTTVDFVGARSIEAKTSGNEKKRFTVCLTIAANGRLLPAYVLFQKLKKVPKVTLPSNVLINVNESGTMIESLVCDYFNKVFGQDAAHNKQIIFMNEFKSHFTQPVIETLQRMQVNAHKIPGGYTSSLQPLDVSINKPFNQLYRDEWEAWLDGPDPIYTKKGNRQKPSYQCIVDMISRCLIKMESQIEMIKNSFVLLISTCAYK